MNITDIHIADRVVTDIHGVKHTIDGEEIRLDDVRRVWARPYSCKGDGHPGYIIIFTDKDGLERTVPLSAEAAEALALLLAQLLDADTIALRWMVSVVEEAQAGG